MAMKFEHTAYNVPDPAAQAQWHIAHTGMVLLRAVGDATNIHFIGDPDGCFTLELYHNPISEIPDQHQISKWTQHIAFTTDDIEAEMSRLMAAGATRDGEISVVATGDKAGFVRDPWGLCLQFVQRIRPLRRPPAG